MKSRYGELTGLASVYERSSACIADLEQCALLTVPNRGTIATNHAIAYFWLRYMGLLENAVVESTENRVEIRFDMNKPPFTTLNEEQQDMIADDYLWHLVHWVNQQFLCHLFKHQDIFREDFE